MSQKEASEIYPWKGHPPKRKDVCVCVNEGNVLKYILYFGVPGVSLLELS